MRHLISYRLACRPGRIHHIEGRRKWNVGGVAPHDESARRLNPAGRHLHARPLHDPTINRVAQVHITVHRAQCFQISQSRESDHEIFLGVRQCQQCAVLVGLFQDLIFEVGSIAKNVRVGIDQARKNGRVTQINDLTPKWNLDFVSWSNLSDPVAVNQNNLIRREHVGPSEEPAGTDVNPVIRRSGRLGNGHCASQ